MSPTEQAEPAENKFFTPGVFVLLGLMVTGAAFAVVRFLFGLGAVTNLSNRFPWGLWIGFDVVTGVALAAGGFTTSALVYVFNRRQYHAVIRPALLTAMLGYTFVVLGLFVDIGRYWNIWRPLISWNPTSVLFEVGMCVAIYSTVLYIEFIPIVVERFQGRVSLPGPIGVFNSLIEWLLRLADLVLSKVMFLFIIAGVVLSCLHQSALGSLMLVATYKVHPLWYTPILPLLFLLSAIAVGYPMVVFESMIASRSLKRKAEMEVLTPLARFMPVLIGIYLVFKLGDMVARGTYMYLFDGTLQSNSFLVEIIFGLILPFVLLLMRRVRESAGWLFFASLLYLGVVLNRVNVFLVGFSPPYMTERYFPAVGEIAITVGFIAALIFLYRLFVTIFPVLGAHSKRKAVALLLIPFFLMFWLLISGNSAEAEAFNEKKTIPPAKKVMPSIDDAPKMRILDSPLINKYSDLYEQVRFMHAKHANVVKDCTICHHRVPREKGDKYGKPATMKELTGTKTMPKACSSCHDRPWNPERIHVPGLKGAYHQLCIACHRVSRQKAGTNKVRYRSFIKGLKGARTLVSRAPLDCVSCHPRKVPDHKDLVELDGNVDALSVTKTCLSCHESQGGAVLNTGHWKWQGSSPFTLGNEKRIDLGKRFQGINNTTISLTANWPKCTGCHIGYGWKGENFDFTDMTKIDCLVCHDGTGTYQKSLMQAGFPERSAKLLNVAQHVGKPNRRTCGSCHFSGGMADPVKHAEMNPKLLDPVRNMDVHMASDGMDFRCQECHKTRKHKISGRSVFVPWVEGYFSCEGCHTQKPHIGSNLLAYHLNKHTDHVACQTCHIPIYSKGSPVITRWDWSTAGKDPGKNEPHGKTATFEKAYGSLTWKRCVKPVYLWYNGTVKRYLLGDPINEGGVTELNRPEGNRQDSDSRIYPFKAVTGKQLSDAVYKFLVPPKLWHGYWEHWDWNKAASEGLTAAGLPHSGKYKFVETIAYHGVNHEVLPKERALSCAQCHAALNNERACGRCHKSSGDIDFKALAHKGIDFRQMVKEGYHAAELIGRTDYINFKALGYAGDPIEVGGRFETLPLQTGAQPPPSYESFWSKEQGDLCNPSTLW